MTLTFEGFGDAPESVFLLAPQDKQRIWTPVINMGHDDWSETADADHDFKS